MSKVYPSVKAIITKGDKFLIIQQQLSHKTVWDLPGGKVEYGESPFDTLIREIQEEVGLSINIVRSLGVFWFFRADNDQVVCSTFLCKPTDTTIDIDSNPAAENITEYRWVTKDEFLNDEYEVSHCSLQDLISSLDISNPN